MKEQLAFIDMTVASALAMVGATLESWRSDPFDPCHVAGMSALAVPALLLVARVRGPRPRFELSVLVAFLIGMPLVYIASWLWTTPHDSVSWLGVELAGLAVYVALAIAG